MRQRGEQRRPTRRVHEGEFVVTILDVWRVTVKHAPSGVEPEWIVLGAAAADVVSNRGNHAEGGDSAKDRQEQSAKQDGARRIRSGHNRRRFVASPANEIQPPLA